MAPSVRPDALFCLEACGGENHVPGYKTGSVGASPIVALVSEPKVIPPAAGPCVKEEVVIL